jgi:ubiquinone/menaquinone biosynthesis C-methylase UbiE
MFDHFHLQTHEKVASIGCGGGLWEVLASFDTQQVAFHLQDINPELLNDQNLKETITYFEKQFGRPSDCSIQVTIGTPKETGLSTKYFDKVLLINSFHEFEYQIEMLVECQRILKPNGQLIVEEQPAKFSGELHEGCGKRLYLETELIDLFNKNGFQLIESQIFENKMYLKFSAIV